MKTLPFNLINIIFVILLTIFTHLAYAEELLAIGTIEPCDNKSNHSCFFVNKDTPDNLTYKLEMNQYTESMKDIKGIFFKIRGEIKKDGILIIKYPPVVHLQTYEEIIYPTNGVLEYKSK